MPDGWEKLSYLKEGWCKGRCTVLRTFSGWGYRGYAWIDTGVGVLNGGFPDPVSCAVACELATGGCTDGHA
jgi:hypothetical protein